MKASPRRRVDLDRSPAVIVYSLAIVIAAAVAILVWLFGDGNAPSDRYRTVVNVGAWCLVVIGPVWLARRLIQKRRAAAKRR